MIPSAVQLLGAILLYQFFPVVTLISPPFKKIFAISPQSGIH